MESLHRLEVAVGAVHGLGRDLVLSDGNGKRREFVRGERQISVRSPSPSIC
jgi:hypothetical protein